MNFRKQNPINEQKRATFGLALITAIVVIPVLLIIGVVFAKGISVIDWNFLTTVPTNGLREGGVFPAIIGPLILVVLDVAICVPFGLSLIHI